jgi:hypothetical protein
MLIGSSTALMWSMRALRRNEVVALTLSVLAMLLLTLGIVFFVQSY